MCEIMAEMGRNARIAEINRTIEVRVRGNVGKALAALMPACAGTDALERLTDLVMLFSIGLVSRRIADPDMDMVAVSCELGRIVDSELARLQMRTCSGGLPGAAPLR
jgi:hypothetical protein